MKIKVVVIDLELTPASKRVFVRAFIVAGVIAAATVASASVPHSFTPASVLKAQDLNDNFSSLDQRLSALEAKANLATVNGKSITTNAVFVGVTTTSFNGNLGGFAGARSQCAGQFGATAHMCTTEEISRSLALGVTIGTGASSCAWFGTALSYAASPNGASSNIQLVLDCSNWTSASEPHLATCVETGGVPAEVACSQVNPIACCD